MVNPPYPGLSVRHDCLEPLNLSVKEKRRANLVSTASDENSKSDQGRKFSSAIENQEDNNLFSLESTETWVRVARAELCWEFNGLFANLIRETTALFLRGDQHLQPPLGGQRLGTSLSNYCTNILIQPVTRGWALILNPRELPARLLLTFEPKTDRAAPNR